MRLRVDPSMEVPPEAQDEEMCAILVYGNVPEFMPHCAFRRTKHYKKTDKKEIKCPYCGGLFKVVDKTEKLELIRYPKKTKIYWDTSLPCGICRNMVGIIYASAS